MNRRELEQRMESLNPKFSADAVKLLRLILKLSAEGKIKNSIMQNEIPNLLQNVEEAEKIQRRINSRRFFLQFAGLIDSVSVTKLKIPNDVELNVQKKAAVDEKISSLMVSINKILREDGPLEVDFNYQTQSNEVKIISYIGPKFDVIKIPQTIEGREVKVIGTSAFRNNTMHEIIIPDSVVRLESYAFFDCNSLSKITLGKNLQVIGDYVFNNVAAKKIIIPETVTQIGENAFKTSAPRLKILFGSKNDSLHLFRILAAIKSKFSRKTSSKGNLKLNFSRNSFDSPSTLYCQDIELKKYLEKLFGKNSSIKISDNKPEFFEDGTGAILHHATTLAVYLVIIGTILVMGIQLLPFISVLILFLLLVIIGSALKLEGNAIPIYVVASLAIMYFGGGYIYDKTSEVKGSTIDFFYENVHPNEDRLLNVAGDIPILLNESNGVDRTIVSYNTKIQGLYEVAMQKNASSDMAAFDSIFVQSYTVEENSNDGVVFNAVLNNGDYILFQTNVSGYIATATIFIREDHTSIIRPVLENLIKSVASVEIKNSVLQKVLDEIIAGETPIAFKSFLAHRNFKISQRKDKNFFKYFIQANIK